MILLCFQAASKYRAGWWVSSSEVLGTAGGKMEGMGGGLRHPRGKGSAEKAFVGISTGEATRNLDLFESYFLRSVVCSAKLLHSWLFCSV